MPADACQVATPTSTTPCWSALVPHRNHLVRFARQRLLDPALAEDLVHDVFEVVVAGRAAYAGRASLRTWLVGILKHKIVDMVRQRAGWVSLDADDDADASCGRSAPLECPRPGPDEVAAQRERLMQTLEQIGQLPDSLRQVVDQCLLQDRDIDHVCRSLGLTRSNLFVRIHRARRRLAGRAEGRCCQASGRPAPRCGGSTGSKDVAARPAEAVKPRMAGPPPKPAKATAVEQEPEAARPPKSPKAPRHPSGGSSQCATASRCPRLMSHGSARQAGCAPGRR